MVPTLYDASIQALMSSSRIRIGTRSSQLALWQANYVRARLAALYPEVSIELVAITTTGDREITQPLRHVGGKALFLKEIEEALLNNAVDIAVHSLKDMPVELLAGLKLAAMLAREDARDALILARGNKLKSGAVIGTGSLRRRTQLAHWRPDLAFADIRGNIDTRLAKLAAGEFDALVLAAAGLKRMGWQHQITTTFAPSRMVPAVGQGVIGIELRADDQHTQSLIAPLHDASTAQCALAERAFARAAGGDCSLPIAAFGQLQQEQLHLTACIADLDGTQILKTETTGAPDACEDIGKRAAEQMLDNPEGSAIIGRWRELGPG